MRVFVTGGTGFLGATLINLLKTNQDIELITPTSKDCNLLEKSSVIKNLEKYAPDTILHLAAKVGGIFANINNPTNFLLQNIQMDSNIISSAIEKGVKEFLYIGSSCMYPLETPEPFKEIDLKFGSFEKTNEGYAIAINVGIALIEKICLEFGLDYRCVILSNLYGREKIKSNANAHLISSALDKFIEADKSNKDTIQIYGSGTVKREFTHVTDVAEWLAMQIRDISKLPTRLNLGSGSNLTVREYYDQVNSNFDYRFGYYFDLSYADGIKSKLLDSTIAQEKYGWEPKIKIDIGIKDALKYKQRLYDSKK